VAWAPFCMKFHLSLCVYIYINSLYILIYPHYKFRFWRLYPIISPLNTVSLNQLMYSLVKS
jgi:hypothetical protein